jgi:hypothetical protein
VSSPPVGAAAARCDNEGAAATGGLLELMGIEVVPYVVAAPGIVPTAGPLVPPAGAAGGTV